MGKRTALYFGLGDTEILTCDAVAFKAMQPSADGNIRFDPVHRTDLFYKEVVMECPVCGSMKIQFIKGRAYLRCNSCGYVWKAKGGCTTC